MTHPLAPESRPSLGGLHAGWATFGDFMTGSARRETARPRRAMTWLRRLMRRLAGPSRAERDLADRCAHLRDDIGLGPSSARPDPAPGAAEMWVGVKSGMYPRR